MIGQRLAKIRKERRMKQEELAAILGVSKHSISLYENNKSSPSDESYMRLARTFDVSIDYLLGLIDEPYSYNRDSQGVIRIPEGIPNGAKSVLGDFVDYMWDRYSVREEAEA